MAINDRHAELVDKLTDGIADLTSSDQWRRYLDFQARFHRYSAGNVLLVLAQRPNATRVAGFRAWLSYGRAVRNGVSLRRLHRSSQPRSPSQRRRHSSRECVRESARTILYASHPHCR